jgi:hypothetical protein
LICSSSVTIKEQMNLFLFISHPLLQNIIRLGLDRYLRFFTIEEYETKLDFIKVTEMWVEIDYMELRGHECN